MKMKAGTNLHKVYNALLQHEYMKKSTIAKKINMTPSTLSSCLTKLRRYGLAEYSGKFGEDLHWKKHPINKPLYPAQSDLLIKKNKKIIDKPDVDSQMIISRINVLVDELVSELQLLKKRCDSYVATDIVVNGEQLYKKINL